MVLKQLLKWKFFRKITGRGFDLPFKIIIFIFFIMEFFVLNNFQIVKVFKDWIIVYIAT